MELFKLQGNSEALGNQQIFERYPLQIESQKRKFSVFQARMNKTHNPLKQQQQKPTKNLPQMYLPKCEHR